MARDSHYKDHRSEVLKVIREKDLSHGKPPSIRELAGAVDVGVATMHHYLERLREEGLVEWQPGKHRSLRLTPVGSQLL